MATRERSRAYPAYELAYAVDCTNMLHRSFGCGQFDRNLAAKALRGVPSSRVHRMVAALVQYGLLVLKSNSYRVSELGKRVVLPIDEAEFRASVRTAFENPPLFRDLIDHLEGSGRVPDQLTSILMRSFRITSGAASTAADVFIKSGRFAGWIDCENSIASGAGTPETAQDTTEETEQTAVTTNADVMSCVVSEPAMQLAREPGNHHTHELPLSQGVARLTLPCQLSNGDIRLLSKMVELWALQVEVAEGEA